MQPKHNRELVPLARELRRNMTQEERRLWYDFLRSYPVRFYRQRVLGSCIVDFYRARVRLVIELDGSQHAQSEAVLRDAEHTAFLQSYGLQVLRIPNPDVRRHFSAVCALIDLTVQQALRQQEK